MRVFTLFWGASKVLRSKVAGVSFGNPGGGLRQAIIRRLVRPGMSLVAIPEPDNPFDPNAVGLWVRGRSGLEQVGYVPRELAARLRGRKVAVKVLAVTGGTGGKGLHGLVVAIAPRLGLAARVLLMASKVGLLVGAGLLLWLGFRRARAWLRRAREARGVEVVTLGVADDTGLELVE